MKLKRRRPKKSPWARKKKVRRSISNQWYFLPRNKKHNNLFIWMISPYLYRRNPGRKRKEQKRRRRQKLC